jgi:hypothetical protein
MEEILAELEEAPDSVLILFEPPAG